MGFRQRTDIVNESIFQKLATSRASSGIFDHHRCSQDLEANIKELPSLAKLSLVKNGRGCLTPNSLDYQRLFRGIACHIAIAPDISLASFTKLHDEQAVFCIIDETS
jgi:hypothetical protein